jgi:putative copper export protein
MRAATLPLVLASADTIIRSLHLIGAAVWVGGMVMLALAVGAARSTVAEPERIALFRALGRRFLVAGGIAMLVLIATGTDMAADRLQAWGDLTDSDYGERLLAKLVVVAVVIGLTLFHSLVQGPALSRLRAEAPERPGDAELRRLIRRKAARAGMVSALNLVASIAVLVLAARLVTA